MEKIIVSNCDECPLFIFCKDYNYVYAYKIFNNCDITYLKTKTCEYQWYHPVAKKTNEIKDLKE